MAIECDLKLSEFAHGGIDKALLWLRQDVQALLQQTGVGQDVQHGVLHSKAKDDLITPASNLMIPNHSLTTQISGERSESDAFGSLVGDEPACFRYPQCFGNCGYSRYPLPAVNLLPHVGDIRKRPRYPLPAAAVRVRYPPIFIIFFASFTHAETTLSMALSD